MFEKLAQVAALLCQEECHGQAGAKRCWHAIKTRWASVAVKLCGWPLALGELNNSWRKLLVPLRRQFTPLTLTETFDIWTWKVSGARCTNRKKGAIIQQSTGQNSNAVRRSTSLAVVMRAGLRKGWRQQHRVSVCCSMRRVCLRGAEGFHYQFIVGGLVTHWLSVATCEIFQMFLKKQDIC